MSEKERAFQICQCRNLMLDNLRATYPGSLSGKVIFRAMVGTLGDYARQDCSKDLHYLEQKGYVLRKNRRGRLDPEVEWEEAYWTLTAVGNEVANKLIVDPALEI